MCIMCCVQSVNTEYEIDSNQRNQTAIKYNTFKLILSENMLIIYSKAILMNTIR